MSKRYPILFPLFGLITGILISGFIEPNLLIAITSGAIAVFIFLALSVFPKLRVSSLFALLFCSVGFAFTAMQTGTLMENHYSHLPLIKAYYKAKLLDSPKPTQKALRLELELEERLDSALYPVAGKIFLYVPKDSILSGLLTDDEILFHAQLKPVHAPKNPHEFDYKNYLNLHQIYQQGYTQDIKILRRSHSGFLNQVDRYRSLLRARIVQLDLDEEEEAVATALLLGYRHLLSDETQKAFAGAGAMHVLAVSGLHVGILYLITAFLLKIDRRKQHKNNWKKVMLVIAIIWAYAVLTGLSPSVSRAAVMFSIVSLGGLFKRRPSIYQSIAVSAIILLVINPNNLFEVGFQLSYAAVLSIVFIQPKLYYLKRKPFRNKFMDVTWGIVTVSIAAQLGTFPLSMYYFHQFPNFFLISNLIVIPLAYLLMFIGMFLLLISIFFVPPAFVVAIFKGLLWAMTKSVHFVESLPYSVVYGLTLSRLELVLLTALVISLVIVIFEKKKQALFASLTLGIVLLLLNINHKIDQRNQKLLTFYSIRNDVAIQVQNGNSGALLLTKGLKEDKNKMLFHIRHNQWSGSVDFDEHLIERPISNNIIQQRENIVDVLGKRILIFNDARDTLKFKLNPDFLLVSKNISPPKQFLTHPLIILQDGLNEKTRNAWLCLPFKVHDLSEIYYSANITY